MIAPTGFRERLRRGEVVFGPLVQSPAVSVVEVLGLGGFDFVLFDQEHGPISVGDVAALTAACCGTSTAPLVRLRSSFPPDISAILDCGVAGIHAPRVDSAETAASIVRASRFHPEGSRGLNPFVRAASYSQQHIDEFITAANREVTIIISIEGRAAIEHLDEVIAVRGIDVVFFGPYDLSNALGVPGQIFHPVVVEKLKSSVQKVKRVGIAPGVFAETVEAALRWVECGVQYIVFSVDTRLLFEVTQERVRDLRQSAGTLVAARASGAAKD